MSTRFVSALPMTVLIDGGIVVIGLVVGLVIIKLRRVLRGVVNSSRI